MKIQNCTITIFAENKPGILYRISDLFLRKKVNIESLTVSEVEDQGISRFTIVVREDELIIQKTIKQLYRIVEVIKVFENSDDQLIFKEIGLIKVSTKNTKIRHDIEGIVRLLHASIIYVNKDSLTIEKTGSEEEVRSLYLMLKPFGIKEYVHSGRIAVLKDEKNVSGKINPIEK